MLQEQIYFSTLPFYRKYSNRDLEFADGGDVLQFSPIFGKLFTNSKNSRLIGPQGCDEGNYKITEQNSIDSHHWVTGTYPNPIEVENSMCKRLSGSCIPPSSQAQKAQIVLSTSTLLNILPQKAEALRIAWFRTTVCHVTYG